MRVKNTNEYPRLITLKNGDDELVLELEPGAETDVDDRFGDSVKSCPDLSVLSAKRAKEKE